MNCFRLSRLRAIVTPAAAIAAALGLGAPASDAASLTPGNILVSNLNTGVLTEFTSAGAVVQTFAFPDFSGGFNDLRDIVVGPDGDVQAYNGTFTPQLSTLAPSTGTITSRAFGGWSTVNNISYGGIGAFGDGVFVTDMATAGAGAPQGIVRFSTSGGAMVRFGEAHEYQDLTIGGDGLLYALRGDLLPNSNVDVFDPTSFSLLRTITLDATVGGADVRGIAVSAAGTLFAAAWNGSVYAADLDGNFLNSRSTGVNDLTDIDLDDLGRLVVGSRFGDVILTDVTLASQTSFAGGGSSGDTIHVAFATPLSVGVIPEPPSLALATMPALLGLLGLGWRRRRRLLNLG